MTVFVSFSVSGSISFVDVRTDERSEMNDIEPNHTMSTSANQWQAS